MLTRDSQFRIIIELDEPFRGARNVKRVSASSQQATENASVIRTLIQPSGLAVIEMADPTGLNAIDAEFASRLADAVETVRGADNVRLVLLRSSGRCFGVGGNLSWFDVEQEGLEQRIETTLGAIRRVIQGLRSMPAIVVAAVHGAVAGGSIGLVLAADLVIARADTRLSMAYARIGATPDAATSYFLTRQLGERRALELLLFSESLDAEEARHLGLVNFVATAAEFENACNELIKRLLNGPAAALLAAKRLVQAAGAFRLSDQMEMETQAFIEISRTDDFIEGVRAFLSKRQPKFTGR